MPLPYKQLPYSNQSDPIPSQKDSSCSSQDVLETNHQEGNRGFRTAPWYILGERKLNSKGDALVLSVIWSAIQSSWTDGTNSETSPKECKITNKEIARRSGIRGGEQAVVKYLQKLEKACFIKRHGNHKNRTIELLLNNSSDNIQCLIIEADVLQSDFSPTQKLLLQVLRSFPKAKKTWICKRLNISDWTYYSNINILQPYKESKCNPIKNLSQPYKKSKSLGIDGRDFGIVCLSKDKQEVVSPPVGILASLSSKERLPTKINSPTKRNDNMSSERIQTTAPAGWLENWLRRSRLESAPIAKRNDFKKKKFEPPKYPAEYVLDMNWIQKNCPFISKHRPDTIVYGEAIRVIRALTLGPSKVLRADEISSIFGKMVGWRINGSGIVIDEAIIRSKFLNRKFSLDERIELYKALNNSMSVEYGGGGKKISLTTALRSFMGWSWLVLVAIKPPEKARNQMPINTEQIETQMKQAIEVIRKETTKEEQAVLARNIIALKKEYMNDYQQRFIAGWNGDGMHYGNWPQFFTEMVDHFYEQNQSVYSGWFRPGGNPVKWFMEYIGFDKPVRKPAQESSQMSHATL